VYLPLSTLRRGTPTATCALTWAGRIAAPAIRRSEVSPVANRTCLPRDWPTNVSIQ